MGRVKELAQQMGAIPAYARRTDPPTSHMAAERKSLTANSHAARIRLALMDLPGQEGTSYAIARASTLTQVQVARMMKSLCEMGYVANTGRTAPDGEGQNECIIWRLK